jgi:biotin carboxylase
LDLAKLYEVQAIASDNCDYILLAAEYLSELLNLPCLGRKAAQISNNKSQQRHLAESASILQPKWKSILSYAGIVDFLQNTACKAMLKPVDSRGSMGITLLSENDSPTHIHKAFAKALSSSPSKQLLVEEYVDGKLLTIDGFLLNEKLILLAIAERDRIGEGKLVTTQILYRSSLPRDLIDQAYRFLNSVVSALGYTKGHVHCEALLTDSKKLFLVECTNRGGGVFTSSTINPYVSSLDVNSMYMNEKQCSSIDINMSDMDSVKWANTNNASLIFPALGSPGQVLSRFDTE